MKLQFKLGTSSLEVHEIHFVPMIGNIVDLNYIRTGRKHPVRITDISRSSDNIPENNIYYGEWL